MCKQLYILSLKNNDKETLIFMQNYTENIVLWTNKKNLQNKNISVIKLKKTDYY